MNSKQHFADKLADCVLDSRSVLCVGIDPVFEDLPDVCRTDPPPPRRVWQFLDYVRSLIAATWKHVAAFKFQSACFERYGPEGMTCMLDLMRTAKGTGRVVIWDAKRGDIGVSLRHYYAAVRYYDVDAMTINPYFGGDLFGPYLEEFPDLDVGLFVLARTTNPSAAFIQDQRIVGQSGWGGPPTLYARVAQLCFDASVRPGRSHASPVGLVAGCTTPDQLAHVRSLAPNNWILVPGLGAQGGDAAGCAPAFFRSNNHALGALVNVSRGLVQGLNGPSWSDQARINVHTFNAMLAKATPAGLLLDGVDK